MGADLLRWSEVLDHCGAGLEDLAFGRARVAGDIVAVFGEVRHGYLFAVEELFNDLIRLI